MIICKQHIDYHEKYIVTVVHACSLDYQKLSLGRPVYSQSFLEVGGSKSGMVTHSELRIMLSSNQHANAKGV